MAGADDLLERDDLLGLLDRLLADAASGAGSVAMVAGEAGIGKTCLVRAFCARHERRAQVLWGACDALRTPRALGPLHDIARGAGGRLAEVMSADAPRHDRFTAVLDALVSPLRPVVVVVEDAHWADEATLDMLVFLARRVRDTHALVLVTHRDDELGPDHPLRRVRGDLVGHGGVHRLRVPRLSEPATARLAAVHGADPGRVYRVTGGNPFFVTEVLAAPAEAVPETVREAVLARVARLSRPARAALEAVAMVPDGADLALVRAVAGDPGASCVDECVAAGVLVAADPGVRFRHELARLAVEQAVPPGRTTELHTAVLTHLAGRAGAEPARLAYHADQAGDVAAVLVHAPAAAAEAAKLGAHREAAAHYESALRYAGQLPAARRADLLERYAEECARLDRVDDSVAATGEALAIWRELGDVERAGAVMGRRSQFLASAARAAEAHESARAALAMLAGRPASIATAAVHTYAAYLRMLASDTAGAIDLGTRAAALARRYRDPLLLARALNAVGSAQWLVEPDQAEETMTRGLRAAHESGNDLVVASLLVNLGSAAGEVRRYQVADRWLARAVAWSAEHDLDYYHTYGRAWLSRCHFEQGRWDRAATVAGEVAALAGVGHVPSTIVALTVLGRLRVRRGEAGGAARPGSDAGPEGAPGPGRDGAPAALAEAWRLAVRAEDLQRRWPVAAARAEAAWLAGEPERIPDLVGPTYELALALRHPWAVGELAYWLWRSGHLTGAPAGAAAPYACQIAGDWGGAAAAWDKLGCPYEAATARAEGDQPGELLVALETFHRLGARPAANHLTRRLRSLGVRRLPRRPHRSTQANPAGLTDRQVEVLSLLSGGLTNAEIAARLHISRRTADHHVSAILAKLGAGSRRDASELARRWLRPAAS